MKVNNVFDLHRIKILKLRKKLRWSDVSAGIKKETGLSITPRYLMYCISENSIHTIDLCAIAQFFDVPVSYFITNEVGDK